MEKVESTIVKASECESKDDKLLTATVNLHENTVAKRPKAPEKWKQNVRKRLRQSGQEYVSITGKVVNKRQVRPGCSTTCHLRCPLQISPEKRQAIHNTFWKLTDEQKNYFYWKYTSRILPKRRRATSSEDTRRGYTFKYRFELKGELEYVCSKFFFATLDISPRRIYYFYDHCYDEEICMPRADATHGKGKKRMPQLAQRLEEIREHIKTFTTECKDGFDKLCLPSGMDLATMYRMYQESTQKPLKQHWYNKVFHKEFKLEFQTPKNAENKNGTLMDPETDEESNETTALTYVIYELQPATKTIKELEWDRRDNTNT